jgi:hypothetical protein
MANKYLIGVKKSSLAAEETPNKYETFAKGYSKVLNNSKAGAASTRPFLPRFGGSGAQENTTSTTTTTTTSNLEFMIAGAVLLDLDLGGAPFPSSEAACAFIENAVTDSFYTPGGVLIANGVQISRESNFTPFTEGWYVYGYYDGEPIDPRQIFYVDENSLVSDLAVC